MIHSNLNLYEFLARYNNDFDEINFKKKGDEETINYTDLIKTYDLTVLWIYELGIDQLGDLYIVFEEKI